MLESPISWPFSTCRGKMRISADILVTNRQLSSHNIKGKSKSLRSSLAIGKKEVKSGSKEPEIFMLLCSSQNRGGTKYGLVQNVEKVFTKFVNEGKATIRMISPPVDIGIQKCEVVPLKAFLTILRKVLEGKDISGLSLSAMNPASTAQLAKPTTKMIILNMKDYPITANFPSSLETLQLLELRRVRMDSRIFKLRHLRVLDFTGNALKEFPEALNTLKLNELNMSKNLIEGISPKVFASGSNLVQSLVKLDLSGNRIPSVPHQLCDCGSIQSLNLSENQLERLPINIGAMPNLQDLRIASNRIRSLPGSLLSHRLDFIDLIDNPWEDFDQAGKILFDSLSRESLIDHCLRVCARSSIAITPETAPRPILEIWKARQICPCGRLCFLKKMVIQTSIRVGRIAQSYAFEQTLVPFEMFMCSQKCMKRFSANPYSV